MEEIFDIVDDHDRVIGQAPRAEVHRQHWQHRAVHVLVFNPRGELFVQKRAATKDEYPGRADSSAAGHLTTGEDYDQAAVRELAEELGLTVPAAQWQKLFQIPAGPATGWEFVWVYRVDTDIEPRINRHEIESGSFWPWADVVTAVANAPDSFAPGFVNIIAALQTHPAFRIRHSGQTP